jgi:hypothetical protein
MLQQEENGNPPAAAAGAVSGAHNLRLPRFWANSPAAWFRTAEAQFALRRVSDPLEKYYLVLDTLSEANINLVRHIVEDEPDATSFNRIREGLVAAHILTDYQRIDRLVALEPLNGRKPSELLADMNKLKPADEKQFFAYFFLNRLLREVRILLSQEPVSDMRALAAKADALMALHVPHQHEVAAVSTQESDEATVAAAARSSSSGSKKAAAQKKKKYRRQRSQSAADERRSPLCWLHIRFGDKARRCEQPCAWPAAAEN